MKKAVIFLLMFFLLFTSCTDNYDEIIELKKETETVMLMEATGIPVIINKNSGTYHLDEACRYLARMKEENRLNLTVEDISILTKHGYKACKGCAVVKDET